MVRAQIRGTMRRFALLFAALALSACARPPALQGCTRSATHQATWTEDEASDTITTRSEGPTCLQAAVFLVARNGAGDVLWTFASTYYDMTTGGLAPEHAAPVSSQQMDAFLNSWADVTEKRTGELPQWRPGAAAPSAPTFSYSTDYPRETYEAIRARNARMICYAAAAEATQCLAIDPSTNAPALIVAYGP
jgi:hypothetical protein